MLRLDWFYARVAMVEPVGQVPRLPLGDDLMVGHVHARPTSNTAGSDVSPRLKRRLRVKTSLAEVERQERGRSRVPEPPRLRRIESRHSRYSYSGGPP